MTRYEEIAGSDADDWFSVDESVGEVMLNRRLDFDTMENKVTGRLRCSGWEVVRWGPGAKSKLA